MSATPPLEAQATQPLSEKAQLVRQVGNLSMGAVLAFVLYLVIDLLVDAQSNMATEYVAMLDRTLQACKGLSGGGWSGN